MLSLLKVCRCKFSPWGKLWSHKPCGMAKKKKSYYLPLWRSHIPLAFGIFPDQISNPCPLHWQVNSYPLYLQWSTHFSSVQSLSRVWLLATPWTAVHQASQSITNSWSLLKLMSIELVMPSTHLILCHPLLLLPSIFPSSRVFSNESALCIRWPKYWSFSFSNTPSNQHPGLISFNGRWLHHLERVNQHEGRKDKGHHLNTQRQTCLKPENTQYLN